MRAIRRQQFKDMIFTVVSGCLIIVTGFEKSHSALLPVCFENTIAICRLPGNTYELSCGKLPSLSCVFPQVEEGF